MFYGDQINTSHSELKAVRNEPIVLFLTRRDVNIFRNRAICSFLGRYIIYSVQVSVNKDCFNSIEMRHTRLKHLKCSPKADSIIGHDGDIQNAVCSTCNASLMGM